MRRAETSAAEPARAGERGSATVWVLCLCMVFWFTTMAAMTVGAALVARHRAESAADLSALTGARAAARGDQDACDRARRVALAVRARLTACRAGDDGSLLVVAEVAVRGRVARWSDLPPARARARAGGG